MEGVVDITRLEETAVPAKIVTEADPRVTEGQFVPGHVPEGPLKAIVRLTDAPEVPPKLLTKTLRVPL